jgi:type III restriction enzyme
MSNPFFDHPILNSPYSAPRRHWELDPDGQPTQRIIDSRRLAEFITPISKPKKRKRSQSQEQIVFDEGRGLSTKTQQYDPTSIINEVRGNVDAWRSLPHPDQWRVTPETARLLQHWRHHPFSSYRPFFCQVEAAETAIWLTEVAPHFKAGQRLLEHLAAANHDANPELMRLALKLATGAGKTTVMAMLIAWQTVNAVRRGAGKTFSRGFLVCTPGLTIKDRLRVLQPNDPDNYGRALRRQSYELNEERPRSRISSVHFASMSDLEYQDDEPLVLNFRNQAIAADAVLPQLAEALTFEGFSDGSWILEWLKAFAKEFNDTVGDRFVEFL